MEASQVFHNSELFQGFLSSFCPPLSSFELYLQQYPIYKPPINNTCGGSSNSELCELADKYGALTFIDECHATGFLGETGRYLQTPLN